MFTFLRRFTNWLSGTNLKNNRDIQKETKGECVCCVKPIEYCFQRRIIRSNATITGLLVFIVGDAHNISGFVHAMPLCIPVFSLQSILSHPRLLLLSSSKLKSINNKHQHGIC